MSTGSKKKRRIDRVTSVELPPGVLGNLWGHLRRGHVLVRLALCAVTAVAAVGDHARLGAAAALSPGRRAAARYRRPHANSSARIPRRRERPASRPAVWRSRPTIRIRRSSSSFAPSSRTKSRSSWRPSRWPKSTSYGTRIRLPLAEGTPKPTAEEREQQFQKFRETLSAEGALGQVQDCAERVICAAAGKGRAGEIAAGARRQRRNDLRASGGNRYQVSAECSGERGAHRKRRVGAAEVAAWRRCRRPKLPTACLPG